MYYLKYIFIFIRLNNIGLDIVVDELIVYIYVIWNIYLFLCIIFIFFVLFIGMFIFLKNISFYGIFLDVLFDEDNVDW